MSPSPPILEVGPSELDYEFVKVGLHKWPWMSGVLYAGLVGSIAVHMTDGISVIYNKWLRGSGSNIMNKLGQRDRWLLKASFIVIPVLSGLYFIAKEPPMLFQSMAERFETVYMQSGVYPS